jgi:hypothetical protein
MAENNYPEALLTIATMYNLFEITEEQLLELKGMQIYIHWLQQLEAKEGSIYKLQENEINYLTHFVESNTGRGKVFANNILCGLYSICIEETEGGVDNAEGGKRKAEGEESLTVLQSYALTVSKNALEKITLVPNPTTGELRIENGELRIESVEVFDVYGKKHLTVLQSSGLTVSKFDISNLSAGIYFVKIITETGSVVKKVVKK